MPDIFVSYAREDREWVKLLASQLREVGQWHVWWDLKLLPGQQFDEEIENVLDQARCVIVVWSPHSIGSRWVRSEAREGVQRGVLVPLRIHDVLPPLEFRSFETADLSNWNGDVAHPEFVEVVQVVRETIDQPHRGPDAVHASKSSSRVANPPGDVRSVPHSSVTSSTSVLTMSRSRVMWGWAGAAAATAAIAIVADAQLSNRSEPPIVPALASSSITTGAAPAERAERAIASPQEKTTAREKSPNQRPQLSYGTWTLRNAVDDDGGNWNNSTIKFTSQEPVADGLTLQGTMTWRFRDALIGTETFSGRYMDHGQQIFLEGHSVSDARLAVGSYSAVLSPDHRSLLKGTWGSSASPDKLAGVPGHWEATR